MPDELSRMSSRPAHRPHHRQELERNRLFPLALPGSRLFGIQRAPRLGPGRRSLVPGALENCKFTNGCGDIIWIDVDSQWQRMKK